MADKSASRGAFTSTSRPSPSARGDDTPRTKPIEQQRSEGISRPVHDPAGQKFGVAGSLTLNPKDGDKAAGRRPGADAVNPQHVDPKRDDAEKRAAFDKREATEQARIDANSEERTNAVAAEDAIRSGVSAGSGPTRIVLEKDGGILRLVAYGLSPVDTGSILESADLRDGDALAKIRKRGEERAKATGLQWFDQTALPGGEVPARGF